MSCVIVSKKHIDLLVDALFAYEVATPEMGDSDQIGGTLWSENYRSFNFRYGECRRRPAYKFSDREVRDLARQPMTVFKSISCYEYQSCDHDAWEKSKAYNWMKSLEKVVLENGLHMSKDQAYPSEAWRNAPWGI